MKVEVLGFAGCPHLEPAVEAVRAALRETGVDAGVCEIAVEGERAANEHRFLGSPTVRVNGLDVERGAREAREFGIGCRTYVVNGQRQGLPAPEWIRAALREAQSR